MQRRDSVGWSQSESVRDDRIEDGSSSNSNSDSSSVVESTSTRES